MSYLPPKEQLAIITKALDEIISEEELLAKFKKSRDDNKPLRIKAGFDPTAPDLHLGHCVLLKKLRQFQELGHTVVFLVGDFTAKIGDPSGKSATRPPLTDEEVVKNAETYKQQVFKILREDRTEVLFNSSWLAPMSAEELLKLASMENVARMLERDDFQKRYASGVGISIKEFLYPLIQAYDSVCMKADIEFGGTDQKFNILLGREIQRHFHQEPQVAILLPILEGLDGVQKMSKSLGNYIAVEDTPVDIFGKVMSVSDELMWRYYELLSERSDEEITALKSDSHPMDAKKELATELTAWLHGAEAAQSARVDFESKFSSREFPEDAREVRLSRDDILTTLDLVFESSQNLKSRGEAKRLIAQGGVTIDGERVTEINSPISTSGSHEIKIGKKEFVRVTIE